MRPGGPMTQKQEERALIERKAQGVKYMGTGTDVVNT